MIRHLNGGLAAWVAAGYEIERGARSPQPGEGLGREVRGRPDLVKSLAQVKKLRASPHTKLVSVRTRGEHLGRTSGYDDIAAIGRIAGALWGHAGTDALNMSEYEDVDGTLRSYTEIRRMWSKEGIEPTRANVFHCGTGWRASQAFFVAHLMGWERISVFDGGWLEWSRDPTNPIESGAPSRDPAALHTGRTR